MRTNTVRVIETKQDTEVSKVRVSLRSMRRIHSEGVFRPYGKG